MKLPLNRPGVGCSFHFRAVAARRDDTAALAAIQVVRADVHGDDQVALDVEDHAQIGFYIHRVDAAAKASGQAVNLVRTQAWVEGVCLENLPSAPGGIFLL